MDVRITLSRLSGSVTPPPSKSQAHRLLLCAALAQGISTISHVVLSQDIRATLQCMKALGASWVREGSALRITGIGGRARLERLPRMDCGESGSTLRFLIPVALATAGGGVFIGQGRLMDRPQGPYFDLFRAKGITFSREGNTLTVQGQLTPGEYRLPGNVSSQFFTGLLFALPLLSGKSTIVSTTAVESRDYINMTLDALASAGVTAEELASPTTAFSISPGTYRPLEQAVEADWSQAAFWYAAAFLDNAVTPLGLSPTSTQGDRVIASLYWTLARPGDTEIDVSGCPDLLPPLAVMAAVRQGVTRFTGAARLRLKESDRLETTAALLTALGGRAETSQDSLTVSGGALTGGTVDGANDHRIVMAAAVAATACSGPVIIRGAEAVSKSYPSFWADYEALGGRIQWKEES